MVQIGGNLKKKQVAPTKPQFVIQWMAGVNEYAVLKSDDKGNVLLSWVGDPYAATKFGSKYDAKNRTCHIADIPDSRVFLMLEQRKEAV